MFSCTEKPKETGVGSIIPKPQQLEVFPGFFHLDNKTKLAIPKDSAGFEEAKFFSDLFKIPSGIDLPISSDEGTKNVIQLQIISSEEIPQDGYILDISEDKILLQAKSTNGLFYGFQSILQLLPVEIFNSELSNQVSWQVPLCRITDWPRFSWRGMHLDVSRHFFSTDFIKRYIDLIALHKMNVFHWHLTDDNGWRIEIKKYPKLTEVAAWRVDREGISWREVTPPQPGEKATYGGFYTQEEIKDIVAYATTRHISIIPEIEMPGHSCEVFAAYPELSCQGKLLYVQPGSYWPNTDIFCAGNEAVFAFLEDVIDEVVELFPAPYIHVGGDEADKTEWEKCTKCQTRIRKEKLSNEQELQSWFIKRIEKYVQSKGKKMIGWDEILEGGLAPEATVMSWRGMEGGIESARLGQDVIMSPTSYCYFDYYQADPDFEPEAIGGFLSLKKVYSFEPIPEELTLKEAMHVLGGQGNLWTEYISSNEHAEYMALPRMTALSEVLWSPKESRNWEDFQLRLQKQFERFNILKVNYSKGSWKVDIQAQKSPDGFQVKLSSEQFNKPIKYTLDGSVPTESSTNYTGPFIISETTQITAALSENGKLMEYPSVKNIVFHKGLGKSLTLVKPASSQYQANGIQSLVDGLRGSTSYRDGYWMGFRGDDVDCLVDLEEETLITSVSAGFFQNSRNWIFMPQKIIVELLDNNKKLLMKKELTTEATLEAKGTIIETPSADFGGVNARYVRLWAKNIESIPAWHEGAGKKGWIFIDEIVIE